MYIVKRATHPDCRLRRLGFSGLAAGLNHLTPRSCSPHAQCPPTTCSPRSTPSSARSPRRCAGRCGCSPAPAPARPGRSPTGSRTASPPASTRPPRSSRSPSPPAPPARCAPGCARSAPAGVQARTFHSAALRQLRYFWPHVHGTELPTLIESKLGLLATRRPPPAAQRRPGAAARPRLRDRVGQGQQRRTPTTTPRVAAGARPLGRRPRRRRRWRARLRRPTRRSSAARAGWTWRTSCCSPPACSPRTSGSPPRSAGSTSGSSSTSSRTSRRSSPRCSTCGSAAATSCAWSATPPRRSTPSPAPTPTTCATSRRSSPAPPRSSWSATTAPRPEVVDAANTLLAGTASRGVDLRSQQPAGPEVTYTRPARRGRRGRGGRRPDRSRCARRGRDLGEIAILFRINAQSEAFEEALSARGIPYVVRGAARFFDRPEVREAVTRLRGAARSGGGRRVSSRPCAPRSPGMGWTAEAPDRARPDPRPLGVLAGAGRPGDRVRQAARRHARRLRRRPRPPRRRAARPGRRRRHPGHLPRRQGPGVGLGLPLRPPGRHPADHLRRDPGRDRGGAPAPLRRHDPRPASTSRCRGRWRASPGGRGLPQAVPVPRRRCCPQERAAAAAGRPQAARAPDVPRVRQAAPDRRREEARPVRRLPGALRRGAVRAAARVAHRAGRRGERAGVHGLHQRHARSRSPSTSRSHAARPCCGSAASAGRSSRSTARTSSSSSADAA